MKKFTWQGAFGGYFRICLCLKTAVGLVTSKFGLRACGGKLYLMRKKKISRTLLDSFSLNLPSPCYVPGPMPAAAFQWELQGAGPAHGRQQAGDEHPQSKRGARGEGRCPTPSDTVDTAWLPRTKPKGGQRESGVLKPQSPHSRA